MYLENYSSVAYIMCSGSSGIRHRWITASVLQAVCAVSNALEGKSRTTPSGIKVAYTYQSTAANSLVRTGSQT